ncbi:TPA: NAD(P)/FAD-dependent oxidoreductase [Clostridioides difficile]|uniref:phytoene desaturase family protein n=1 Tax=Clostridioides difficile TaxID=1496 RepID=UPI00038D5F58|nr:NAD(P)/FAD-dependent oxidoreductase [Clostridioides difficile]EGT4625350.1 NAD(P)/FAD-dependent oxidoreductase [Clostridioides difficile]ELX4576141.1 NAD(P)/FAD-dependent oxidoreductase [Clostridioides difficile]EQK76091.1 FAD binding domain protein [Clostridioides difficile CD113]MBH6986771.1 NAD(P)/FAD-dependent oxidoreductase [Clostridioides difficile]MBH7139342.1 NAD(P)/FAD-dependent oxidoreductase [Clostridioides difficile]
MIDNTRYDYIIVGAGVGGLSAAVYLAQAGYSVLVLEQHYKPGGYTHSFTRKGCTFDSAVRVVAGAKGNGLLSKMLEKMCINDLECLELDNVYTAVYPELTVHVKAGVEGLINSYSNSFPDDKNDIIRLAEEMSNIYYETISLLENDNPIAVFSDSLYSKYINVPFITFLEKFVKNERLRYCLQAMCGYFGTSPKDGSAAYFSYAIMSFFIEGTYYIKGSFQKLSLRMVDELEKNGGKILFNSAVKKILCDIDSNEAYGVELNTGKQYCAAEVIYNGDFNRLRNELVGEEFFPNRYLKRCSQINVAMSAFEVFIITDLDMRKSSLSHETFVYDLYSYTDVYEAHKSKKQGKMDIHGISLACPTLEDSSLCSEGEHLLIISTMFGFMIEENWDKVKQNYTNKLLEFAEKIVPNLRNHILYLEAATPKTMNRYTLNSQGSCFGWEQNYRQLQYRPKQKTPIKGLYLVGHWTEPGGGVVAAMLSGYKLANKLLKGKV